MSPDDFQKAWRAEASQTRVTIDADALLKSVQRKQHELRETISWGDFSTIGLELLMLEATLLAVFGLLVLLAANLVFKKKLV